jgi:hypothetical protein
MEEVQAKVMGDSKNLHGRWNGGDYNLDDMVTV